MTKLIIILSYYLTDFLLKSNKVDTIARNYLSLNLKLIKNEKKFQNDLNEISKRFIRKDMVCLHKSLVACLLLNKRENEITFNIGLSKHAFESHAWTSVNNIPFTDEPDYIKNKYVVIKEVKVNWNID